MIPRVLRNFNAFVNGVSYAGRVDEVELPEFSVKTEEHRAGGLDAPVEIDLGMEAMSAKLTMAEAVADLIKTFGRMDGSATRLQFRGAIQRDGETAIPLIVDMHGGMKKLTLGSWKAGDKATVEHEMSIRYVRINLGGEDLIEIDVDNMTRVIGGVDELASIRAAIGA